MIGCISASLVYLEQFPCEFISTYNVLKIGHVAALIIAKDLAVTGGVLWLYDTHERNVCV